MSDKKFNHTFRFALHKEAERICKELNDKAQCITTPDEAQAFRQAMARGIERMKAIESSGAAMVPDDALSILEKNGFECITDGSSIDKNIYIDFKRYIEAGFGETGDDRVETITLNEDGTFYPSAVHRDEDGDHWYESSSEASNSLIKVIQWLSDNASLAPKKKEEVE